MPARLAASPLGLGRAVLHGAEAGLDALQRGQGNHGGVPRREWGVRGQGGIGEEVDVVVSFLRVRVSRRRCRRGACGPSPGRDLGRFVVHGGLSRRGFQGEPELLADTVHHAIHHPDEL